MTAPKHQAFLDLEETLARRLRHAWARYWTPLSDQIVTLCSRRDFDSAHRIAESIDLAPLFKRSRTFARTVGMSALLLGASRLRSIRDSRIAKTPPVKELDTFLQQLETMLARNASQALRQMAHAWVDQEEAKLLKGDRARPLYVHRPLLNGEEFVAWAKAQGFTTVLPPDKLHVTIAYSKRPVERAKFRPEERTLRVEGGPREVHPLGDGGAIVLRFDSPALAARWQQLCDGGCSWDYDGYRPHVTITWQMPEGLDLATVEPYTGPLEFGPEHFEDLDEDWKEGVVEKREADRNQVKINVAGKNYFGLAASVQVSRLSAFGFLLEAAESGVRNYRVDAVLDEKTCEVCRHMDGWVFPVSAGLQLAQQIMDTDDPDALKALAPFYAQNKASLAALGAYGTEDFINEGMSLPPYHPLCRCILTPTDEATDVHPTEIADRVALASQTLYGEGDGVKLTQTLFGIEPSEDTARRLGDVVPDLTPENTEVMRWLQGVLEDPAYTFDRKPPTNEQVTEWIQNLVEDWLSQPTADVPPQALITPVPFEGTTIPQDFSEPFDPGKLRQAAEMRWPWLAGILGWLALEPPPTFPDSDEAALQAEEELADEERAEREELREDRRRDLLLPSSANRQGLGQGDQRRVGRGRPPPG